MPNDYLMSVDEVCKALRITKHTFYAYRKKFPAFKTVKVGGRTYMRPETLNRFLEQQEAVQA